MSDERQIGVTENVPAGDDETAKHPANDAVVGATGSENLNEPRDREARLAKDAGARPHAAESADGGNARDGKSYIQQESGPE